jgi:hypothetical protein
MRIASHRGRGLVAALILASFGVHALVPEGFMPGGGGLSIQICPDGFPGQLLSASARHHHGGRLSHTDHCAFGSAGSGGPQTSLSPLAGTALARDAPAVDAFSPAAAVRLVHLPQPRGPPAAA